MQFAGIDNPFGTALYPAPAPIRVKLHKLPRIKRGTPVHRAPKPLSTTIKNFLLDYNG